MKKLMLIMIVMAGYIFCQQPMEIFSATKEIKPYLQLYKISDSYQLCTPGTTPSSIEAGIKYIGLKEGQTVSYPIFLTCAA